MRNIAYSGPHCRVVFLVPGSNDSLNRDLAFLNNVLLPNASAYVQVRYLEDFVRTLSNSNQLELHMSQFKAKYIFTDIV